MYSPWPYIFKTFSKRLEGLFQKRLQGIFKTSSRRSEDVFKAFQDIFKTSGQDVFKTSCKNVFKISSRRLAKMSSRYLQDVLQKCLQDIFKTSWRRIQDLLQRYLLNVFKTYHQVKPFLLTSLREALQRRLSTEGFAWATLLRNLWSVYKIWKSDKNFSSFSFLFTTPFNGCLQRRI